MPRKSSSNSESKLDLDCPLDLQFPEDFGNLDWAAIEPAEITLTLRYDYAILQF